MNRSGDAAEQIVRMSLEGTEVALRLTGSAAKNIAAALYTIMQNKDKNKIRGKQRLTAMLKSGKELKVFTVSEEHLKQFAQEPSGTALSTAPSGARRNPQTAWWM